MCVVTIIHTPIYICNEPTIMIYIYIIVYLYNPYSIITLKGKKIHKKRRTNLKWLKSFRK